MPLHIAFAHNRYLFRGGEDESREQEMVILRAQGHHISEYVVDNRDVAAAGYLATGLRSIWNSREYNRMRKFLRQHQAQILKVDNYFPQLSPAIFAAAKAEGVATVLSVRNYRLVCPAATLWRSGGSCQDCVGHRVALSAIRHRCYRNSALQSAAVVLSNSWSHLRGAWQNSVDHYIAVSRFVREQLIAGGFPAEKISVKPNFISDTGVGDGAGNYAIFVGRLTAEKGIRTLLDAWREIGPSLPLKIIGDGPLEAEVRAAATPSSGVEYLGRRPIAEVCEYLGRAALLIFPSEWLEPFGRTIVEAYSKGTPVIAAETLPMRDMVEHGVTGLLYPSGDARALASSVRSLLAEPRRLAPMRTEARQRYLRDYSAERNYAAMMDIFNCVLARDRNTATASASPAGEPAILERSAAAIPLISAAGKNGLRERI